ncbi:hypothetical protein J6590_098073 [Homalodisca vitripennis]|nr:hypothetical protein J6590_098073 [Homalodisca vitripennis]
MTHAINKDFYATCVDMAKFEIEYLENEDAKWRCKPCSVTDSVTRGWKRRLKKFGAALEFEIDQSMIDDCHTLGSRPNARNPPAIVVEFPNLEKTKQLFTRHLGLTTDIPIYINESLSTDNRKLLALAREARRKNNYKWPWVRGGILIKRGKAAGRESLSVDKAPATDKEDNCVHVHLIPYNLLDS